MIESGQIEYALIVNGEDSRPIQERTIDRLNGPGTVAGVVQFGAWWFYARRSAVGVDGPFAFLGKAEWTPWAGWGLWLAFALVGSLLLAAAPLLSRRLEQRPRGG